jgi:hypothetical protein
MSFKGIRGLVKETFSEWCEQAAGALVIVILWVYYSSQILFLEAEFTQVYARHFGSRIVASPSTEPLSEEAKANQGITPKRPAPGKPKKAFRPEPALWRPQVRSELGSIGSLVVGSILGIFYTLRVRNLTTPRFVTWAAATGGIDSVKQAAIHAGHGFEGPADGSRLKKDGTILRWKTPRPQNNFGGVMPFFIEWDPGSVHPSADAPSGCALEEFELRHPEAQRVREALEQLGITANVSPSDAPGTSASLSTPKGKIRIFR